MQRAREDGEIPTNWDEYVAACKRNKRWIDGLAYQAACDHFTRHIYTYSGVGDTIATVSWVDKVTWFPRDAAKARAALLQPALHVGLWKDHCYILLPDDGEKHKKDTKRPSQQQVQERMRKACRHGGPKSMVSDDSWLGPLGRGSAARRAPSSAPDSWLGPLGRAPSARSARRLPAGAPPTPAPTAARTKPPTATPPAEPPTPAPPTPAPTTTRKRPLSTTAPAPAQKRACTTTTPPPTPARQTPRRRPAAAAARTPLQLCSDYSGARRPTASVPTTAVRTGGRRGGGGRGGGEGEGGDARSGAKQISTAVTERLTWRCGICQELITKPICTKLTRQAWTWKSKGGVIKKGERYVVDNNYYLRHERGNTL